MRSRRARAEVAGLIGAQPDEIVFTGGGTEATNHALKGAALRRAGTRRRKAPADRLQRSGAPRDRGGGRSRLRGSDSRPAVIPVDHHGVIDLDALVAALRAPTLAVSIMHANNETGTVEPVAAVAAAAHRAGALVHVDAAQSAGKLPVDVTALGADLLTLAGHKLYAPKGVGALYVRRGVELEPLIHGAGQESGRRAGTENVPYMVALGAACRIAGEQDWPTPRHACSRCATGCGRRLAAGLGDGVVLNGHPTERLPNTLNASFVGLIGAELLAAVPEIAASTGSACHDGSREHLPGARRHEGRSARRGRSRATERRTPHHRGRSGSCRRAPRRARASAPVDRRRHCHAALQRDSRWARMKRSTCR